MLVTGFMPFGKDTVNPSWEAAKGLPERIGNWEICKLCLPVVFGEAARQAVAAAEACGAEAVLSLGLAGGRAALTPELVGINLRHARIPDNAGRQPQDMPIDPAGPAAYFSTLPVRAMEKAILAQGLPAAVSYSAGAYVCNDLLYSLLRRFEGTPVRAAFLHVPYLPDMGTPSMALADMLRGIAAAIESCG